MFTIVLEPHSHNPAGSVYLPALYRGFGSVSWCSAQQLIISTSSEYLTITLIGKEGTETSPGA